jgi:hypothetical protein
VALVHNSVAFGQGMKIFRELGDALIDIPGKEGDIPEERSPVSSEKEENGKESVSGIFRDNKLQAQLMRTPP